MADADLLYLPLPFEAAEAALVRLSLSTKMVTYLGSGIPIFYHGPAESAAGDLLHRHNAAFLCTCLDPASIAEQLTAAAVNIEQGALRVVNASELAVRQFMIGDQRARFWSAMGAESDVAV
jgi:hypothetical protein